MYQETSLSKQKSHEGAPVQKGAKAQMEMSKGCQRETKVAFTTTLGAKG